MSTPRRRLPRPGDPIWPVPVPIPPQQSGGGGGSGRASERGEDVRQLEPAEGLPIPMVYGKRWVGGRLFLAGSVNNNLVLCYAISLAWNGIDAIEEIQLDGKNITSLRGVTYSTYLGTQSAYDTDIRNCYGDHVEYFTGLAYVRVTITPDSDVFGGVPELRARVRGRKCYNPLTGQTVYTENPVLHALDLLIATDTAKLTYSSFIDHTSWSNAITIAKSVQNSRTLYIASAAITDVKSAIGWANDILQSYFGGIYLLPDGKLGAYVANDTPNNVVTLDDDDIVVRDDLYAQQIQVSTVMVDTKKSHYSIEYEDVTRNGEIAKQTSVHSSFEYGLQYGEEVIHHDFTSDAVTAKRLSHTYLNISQYDQKTLDADIVSYISPGTFIRPVHQNLRLVTLHCTGSPITITPNPSAGWPSTVFTFSCVFAPSAWTGDLFSNQNLGISLISTGVRVRLGANTYDIALDNRNVLTDHSLVITWNSTAARIFVFYDDNLYTAQTATGLNVSSSGDGQLFNGFSGEVIQADLRQSWTNTNGRYLVHNKINGSPTYSAFTFSSGGWMFGTTSTWQAGEYYEVYLVTDCAYSPNEYTYHIQAKSLTNIGRDTDYAASTGNTYVLYTEPRASTTYPDHTSTPPSVQSVNYYVQAFDVGGVRQYRANINWTPSQSSFVRTYRVELTVNGQTKTIGEYGRGAGGCTIDIAQPELTHTVGVIPISNVGNPGNGRTVSFVPATAAFGISSVSISGAQYLGTFYSSPATIGYVYHIVVSVYGSIRQIVIQKDGRTIANALNPASSASFDLLSRPLEYIEPNAVTNIAPGDQIDVIVIANDDRTASATYTLPTLSGLSSNPTIPDIGSFLYVGAGPLGIGKMIYGIAPTARYSIPYQDGSWSFVRALRGSITFASNSTTATHTHNLGTTNYSVAFVPLSTSATLYLSDKATNSFTVTRTTTGQALTVDFIIFCGS